MMNLLPLVSIITPCYNGSLFVSRFLDSVINQSYTKIELIIINDGSIDNTEEVILSYKERLESKGIVFKYISQENQGQAAALNKGLKVFTGDFLTWPDSDDLLHQDNIKLRVEYLLKHPEFNVVMSQSSVYSEKGVKTGVLKRKHHFKNDHIFHDLIAEKNVSFAGGAFMFRTSAFLKAIPNRQIYSSRGGQNWQMLLPVLYENGCGYVDKELYIIIEREGSHSRSIMDLSNQLTRCDVHQDILINVIQSINSMPQDEKTKYNALIIGKYRHKRLRIASGFRHKELSSDYFNVLRSHSQANFIDWIYYQYGTKKYFYYLVHILKAFKKKVFFC